MRAIVNAYGRAFLSQLHGKMLLLSVLPFVLSLLLWALLLWWGGQPLLDFISRQFVDHDGFRASGNLLASVGLGVLKTIIVPLLAILLLLPLMIVTAMLFIGVAAMPALMRHVGGRHFAKLERKRGGGWWGSLRNAGVVFVVFVLVWLLTLPLFVLPPLALPVQALLWGWMTYRVMAYDALADYADADERRQLMRQHRWPLLAIGTISGLAGALPGMLWLGGAAFSMAFFAFLPAVSIWLYVLIFIFTGLWFAYYCLEALARLRGAAPMVDTPPADM